MLTDEQRKERKNFLGSSDISCLFVDDNSKSLNPFMTSMDLYNSKVFDLEDMPETKAMSRGNRYESALIEYAKQELNKTIETDPYLVRFICKEHPVFACNLDGYTIANPCEIVEAKTTGLSGEWGEPGTDDVPSRVILQVQHQMLCTGWEKAHIVVLIGKFPLTEEMYSVERNESIISSIIERGEQFWQDHVLKKIPPEETESGNIQIFKRIVRVPNKYAEVDPNIIKAWDNAREERLLAQKEEKAALTVLLNKLGDAEGAKISNEKEFTYFSQKGKDNLDLKKLRVEYPEVYAHIATESSHRVARIRKIK